MLGPKSILRGHLGRSMRSCFMQCARRRGSSNASSNRSRSRRGRRGGASAHPGHAQVFRVVHGSKVQFINDDSSGKSHTASGLGSAAFPRAFDNRSGLRRSGTTVNGLLTWSTGTMNHGQKSQVLTIGSVGHYFFGCAFHYTTKPTTTNKSMGDVIVSM